METCLFLVFPLGMQVYHTSLSPGTSSMPREELLGKTTTIIISRNKGEESLSGERKPKWEKKVQSYPGIWLNCFLSQTQKVRTYSNVSSFLGKFPIVLRISSKNLVKLNETVLSRKFTIGVFLAITITI